MMRVVEFLKFKKYQDACNCVEELKRYNFLTLETFYEICLKHNCEPNIHKNFDDNKYGWYDISIKTFTIYVEGNMFYLHCPPLFKFN